MRAMLVQWMCGAGDQHVPGVPPRDLELRMACEAVFVAPKSSAPR
jgi:hypothetical protein